MKQLAVRVLGRCSVIAATTGLFAGTGAMLTACPASVTVPAPVAEELPAGVAPPVFTCDEDAERPADLPLPRLSRVQLEHTLRFAIALALPTDADDVWAAASSAFVRYPADVIAPAPGDLRGGYSRIDQGIQQARIDAMYDVAVILGRELTSTPARRAQLLGACATNEDVADDRPCLEAFVADWGARVMRAPLSADDVAFFADAAGDTPVAAEGVADVVVAILNAPQTLYRVEHGTSDGTDAPLSAFELAARLSLHFWQAPPDDELWAAAVDGSLLTDDGYAAQLDRIVHSPLVRASLDELAREWLRLEELPPLDALAADPAFLAFAGDVPTPSARDGMIADVVSAFGQTLVEDGSLGDFLRDDRAYATDAYVAALYDVPAWDGASEPPQPQGRSGLLTRPALLATGTVGTRPIHKGYLVRNALLCQQLGSPPPDANITPPVASEVATTRDAVTERTGGGVCIGCHATINPPGFITEGYDALGRVRTVERLFDAEGNEVAALPVDTAAVPEIVPGDARVIDDPAVLTAAIDDSQLFESCFARQYFRFAQSRFELPSADGCTLAELERVARSGAPLTEVLQAIATTPAFKQRRFE